jgi:zinc protease
MGFSAAFSRAGAFALVLAAPFWPARAQDDPKTFQFALENGLQVTVVPDHRTPIVTQMLFYRVGAADDPPGLSGLADSFRYTIFRSAASSDQSGRTLESSGEKSSVSTTHDYTAFCEQVTKDRLRSVMTFDAERMATPALSDREMRSARDALLEDRRLRIEIDPQTSLREQLEAALYLSHPYGRPVIGWPEEIRRIGRIEAEGFYNRHYAPNNAYLVVAGDVTPDEVRIDAEASYGKIPARELHPRAEFAQPPRIGATKLTVFSDDVKVPLLVRLYRVASYTEAKPGEAEALQVLAQLIGGDATSALYRELVVKRKLASETGASYEGYTRDDGELGIFAVARPGVQLEALEQAIDVIVNGYMTAAPRPADMERAKTQLSADAVYQRDSQFKLASAYGQSLAIGLTAQDVEDWPDRIRAVSPDSVRNVAASDVILREAVTGYLLPATH